MCLWSASCRQHPTLAWWLFYFCPSLLRPACVLGPGPSARRPRRTFRHPHPSSKVSTLPSGPVHLHASRSAPGLPGWDQGSGCPQAPPVAALATAVPPGAGWPSRGAVAPMPAGTALAALLLCPRGNILARSGTRAWALAPARGPAIPLLLPSWPAVLNVLRIPEGPALGSAHRHCPEGTGAVPTQLPTWAGAAARAKIVRPHQPGTWLPVPLCPPGSPRAPHAL